MRTRTALVLSSVAIAIATEIALAQHAPAAAPSAGAAPLALRRRADWGASIALPGGDSGAVVRRVRAGSPLAIAGVAPGDRILALDGVDARDAYAFRAAQRALRAGDTVRLRVRRAAEPAHAPAAEIAIGFDSVALERIPGATLTYGALRSDRGQILRTVVSRPTGSATAPLPAVLFVPWLSCDPVEKPDPGDDGFAHMLRDIASKSGVILMRVEKPGIGDSEGDCGRGLLENEVAGYQAALRELRRLPGVDASRLFILGGSLGGALAPILAAEDPQGIIGVIAAGGFTKTWYEHMLEIERKRLELLGRTPAEVNAALRGFALFYTEYLLERKTPAEVLESHPDLRNLWYDEPAHQYGRPAAYYHAVQQLDVERAWSTVADRGIPALIVWGEYDWIMGRGDQERAAAIVNARAPGRATLAVLAKTDHGLMTYASLAAAFADEGARYDGAPGRVIVRWLRQQARLSPRQPRSIPAAR